MPGHMDWLRSLSINPSETRLLSGDVNSVLGLWDLPSTQNICMTILPGQSDIEMNAVMDAPFLDNSDFSFVMLTRSGALVCADLRTPGLVQWRKKVHQQKGNHMKISEDGKYLFTSARGDEIKMWDIRKLSADTSMNGYLQIYSQHKSQSLPVGLDFLRHGKYIVTGSDDGSAYIYETLTGLLLNKLPLGHGQVQTACSVDTGGLSFFTSFMDARYMGLVDTEGDDIYHSVESTDQIKSAYARQAWNLVIANHADDILSLIRNFANPPLGYDSWMRIIRESDTPACKKLAANLTHEFEREMMANTPNLVHDLQKFYREQHQLPVKPQHSTRQTASKSDMAPAIRTEWSGAGQARGASK